MDISRKILWSLYAGAIGAAAAVVANKALSRAWLLTTGDEPPALDDPDRPTREAVAWAVASATGMAVATVLASRFAARSWEHALGAPAPSRRKR